MTEKENEYCNGTRKIVVEIAEEAASETRIPRVYKRLSACEPVIALRTADRIDDKGPF